MQVGLSLTAGGCRSEAGRPSWPGTRLASLAHASFAMAADTVQFINSLSPAAAPAPAHSHDHSHGDAGHSHSHDGLNEHGHTHEHLDNPGASLPIPALLECQFLFQYELTHAPAARREVCRTRHARLLFAQLRGARLHRRHRRVRVSRPFSAFCDDAHAGRTRCLSSPVGSGKTALTLALCQKLRKEYNIGASPSPPCQTSSRC